MQLQLTKINQNIQEMSFNLRQFGQIYQHKHEEASVHIFNEMCMSA